MPYPDHFSSFLFHRTWGRDRIQPRALHAYEQRDIDRLKAGIALCEEMQRKMGAVGAVDIRVDHTPEDTIRHLDWEIEQLQDSIAEIRHRPVAEVERAECERDV